MACVVDFKRAFGKVAMYTRESKTLELTNLLAETPRTFEDRNIVFSTDFTDR